ncbi:acetolactate synthase [Agaricicola taiwanensis]|uniref:Acetolactate synthase n=1 Tax=Agaricicola taiwanensis TaxID=591372 RepID=A0A8J2VLP5_9RHOB|nr:thiamine pyrophosphate-requiring protein [Agaricicola taiwanensis]GGE30966.1 acetolactate synthase [Agaricicola taiwanensis]
MDTMQAVARTAAHHLLEALVDVEIEYIFANLGTDHAPLLEEMARWRAEGRKPPEMIICPHESTAVHMALGYAMATGRGQAVLVHVDVGTANAAMGMHNACRSRLPILLMAGKAPYTSHGELKGTRDNYVHFIQEPYDQAALVRPYVKWEYTLQSAAHAGEVVRRAHSLMHSGIKGPVYLMLPREALTGTIETERLQRFDPDWYHPMPSRGASEGDLQELARRLLAAERPLIITSYGGQTPGTSEAIQKLSELVGAAVIENSMVTNINHEMDCFAGGLPGERLGQADVGLVVDSDVPWIPSQGGPAAGSWWAHIDIDAMKTGSPVWSFPANLRIEGQSATILNQLIGLIERDRTDTAANAAAERVTALRAARSKQKERFAAAASDAGQAGALNPSHVLRALGLELQPEDMIFQEAVRNQPALLQQVARPLAGTLSRTAGGGLGASGGMALGYKMARPDRLVVQVVGDGSFYYNAPTSVLAVARQYDLPILTVILDNAGWSAVKESTLRVYPQGAARERGEFSSRFRNDTEFSAMAGMFGFKGYRLDDPAAVTETVREAVRTAREGTSVLLHVRLADH